MDWKCPGHIWRETELLLLAQLSCYLVNRLLYISLYNDMWPLDPSTGIPKESGVGRAFLTHHAMELATHPFPAPRGLLPEAEQLLRERFLFHHRMLLGHLLPTKKE